MFIVIYLSMMVLMSVDFNPAQNFDSVVEM